MKLVALTATLLLWFFAAHSAFGAPRTADPVPRELLDHCVGCDAHGMDLHGRDLHGIRLVGANLDGADLRGANLRGASLTGCNLRNAKLDGADLTDVRMTGVSLEGATFTGAKLQGLKLTGVNFRGAPLASTLRGGLFFRSCTGCDFNRAVLNGLDLSKVRLIGSNLRAANLRGTNLSGAHMIGVDLRDADLTDANLRNAIICYPSSVTSHNGVVTTSGDMQCINLRGAQLRGADLRGVKFCAGSHGAMLRVRVDRGTTEMRRASDAVTPAAAPMAPESHSATTHVVEAHSGDSDADCSPVTGEELRQHSNANLDGARLN